jgi:hypothetical protein
MSGVNTKLEPARLRDFRADLERNPALAELVIALLGDRAPGPERVRIRADAESVDAALARGFALACVNGILVAVELRDARTDR